MTLRISSLFGVCFVLIFACGVLHGQATPRSKPKPASASLTDDQVKSLVKQMGGAKEADQKIATEKLRAAGIDVIPALGKAASEGNRQATNHALEILKTHVEGDDGETRMAAYQALQRLSAGSRPAVAAAAKKIMDDHKDVRAEVDAARRAAKSNKADRAAKKASTPKANPRPASAAAAPANQMRREALEQSLKDAEKSIQEIKKLKLPKDLEAQQISAITRSMQNLREQLKRLDNAGRKK